MEEEENEKLTVYQALDLIVTEFCGTHGGLEEAMPMIRKQFEKHGVDFSEPTIAGLIEVSNGLVDIAKFLKGNETAQELEKKYDRILNRLK